MTGPLAGLTIVDLSGLAGAYGTRLMAALGAEVIKVEPPTGNSLRQLAPFVEGAPEPEASLWWAYLAMGTKSVVLDLTTDDDGTTVLRGVVVDQAALHGLIQKLRDIGVPLLSLTRLPCPDPTRHNPSGATS